MAVVDVRSDEDIEEFEKTLRIGPITIVLVYADWCGHCKTYKKDIWSNIMNWRKEQEENGTAMNQLASVHYDQLPKTSQRNVDLDGYPSVLVVGKDGTAATFPEGKNALPSQTARDLDALKKMLTTAPPPVSAAFSAKAAKLRNKTNTAMRSRNINELMGTHPSPPNSWKDVTHRTSGRTRKMKKSRGKTLLQSLMQGTQLTGGARRSKATRRSRATVVTKRYR